MYCGERFEKYDKNDFEDIKTRFRVLNRIRNNNKKDEEFKEWHLLMKIILKKKLKAISKSRYFKQEPWNCEKVEITEQEYQEALKEFYE